MKFKWVSICFFRFSTCLHISVLDFHSSGHSCHNMEYFGSYWLWIVQIWHYFVMTTVTFDCVHRRRYSSGNCARFSGGPRVLWSLSTCVCSGCMWIALFCRNGHIWLCIGYFGPFQPVKVASPARPSDQIPTGSWDTNGDLCCQFMTSKLLFLLPYTFHRTRNLIGKSLTGWNCLSWPMFFPLELYNQLPFIIDPSNILSNCGKGQKISNNFPAFYLHRAVFN